ncbi:MAG: xanthine dehydrogenase molybdopterin binding subunit [bacterium]
MTPSGDKKLQDRAPYHLSGGLHVTGRSRFIGEDNRPAELLFAKVVLSPYAHAQILNINTTPAAEIPGVVAVLTHLDIPGENQIGLVRQDEPLLPVDQVQYVGQPVAVVVATTPRIAEQAVSKIEVEYEELDPVLTISEALDKDQLYIPERRIKRGDVEQGLQNSEYCMEGKFATGAQEHFYLETQCCIAVPGEDHQITLYSATQSISEVQIAAARILGIQCKDVTVDVPRLGGAFGGKERTATLWACLTALACHQTEKSVELRLTRTEDMLSTGKRHPFEAVYKVGFNQNGKIQAYSVELNSNGGAYTDLSIAILERAMLHAENSYYIPNISITGRACRTNLPPNTAMRGFGAPQSIFVIEQVIERIARKLNIDPLDVRLQNIYKTGELTPYGQPIEEASGGELLERLRQNSQYLELRKSTDEFNQCHQFVKRGIGVVPVKFGISFTSAFLNQGSALIWIYEDGTISLSHGGIEMGQEVNTKVAQVVSSELGVSLARIRQESANTKRVGNASPTAASSGSDINGNAARNAALQLKKRLAEIAQQMLAARYNLKVKEPRIIFAEDRIFDTAAPDRKLNFEEVVKQTYMERVPLGAHGFYKTPGLHFDREKGVGNPFHYFVFGCALTQVEVDLLTGQSDLLKVYIVHETGRSLNPEIDRGQITGGFIQGMGWVCMEEIIADEKGRYLATGPSTYKIPTIRDLPTIFEIEMVEVDREGSSVFRSKAIGEPPFMYAEAVYFAIKDAIEALTEHEKEVELHMPATPEAVVMAAKNHIHLDSTGTT